MTLVASDGLGSGTAIFDAHARSGTTTMIRIRDDRMLTCSIALRFWMHRALILDTNGLPTAARGDLVVQMFAIGTICWRKRRTYNSVTIQLLAPAGTIPLFHFLTVPTYRRLGRRTLLGNALGWRRTTTKISGRNDQVMTLVTNCLIK